MNVQMVILVQQNKMETHQLINQNHSIQKLNALQRASDTQDVSQRAIFQDHKDRIIRPKWLRIRLRRRKWTKKKDKIVIRLEWSSANQV